MLSPQRRALLLEYVQAKGSVKVAELTSLLGVSDFTVRRDIDELVRAGLAERFHGGVTLPTQRPASARRPGAGQTLRFGVLLPDSGYFRDVLGGIAQAVDVMGAQQALVLSRYEAERDLTMIDALIRDKVDGLLLVSPADLEGRSLYAERLRTLPIPAVLIERRLDDDVLLDRLDHVISDHEAGGRMAAEHFVALGHRRLAFVTRRFSPTRGRAQAGFKHAARALGLEDEVPVFEVPSLHPPVADADREMAATVAALREQGITAALVHGDAEAVMISQLAQSARVRVPQDLAIIAYDDDIAEFAGVPLSAVAPAKHDLGAIAAELLARRIRRGSASPVCHISLLPRIVVRDSCGANRRRPRSPNS
jgi:DNA-binding LacI/PurR family transcriptional regulator